MSKRKRINRYTIPIIGVVLCITFFPVVSRARTTRASLDGLLQDIYLKVRSKDAVKELPDTKEKGDIYSQAYTVMKNNIVTDNTAIIEATTTFINKEYTAKQGGCALTFTDTTILLYQNKNIRGTLGEIMQIPSPGNTTVFYETFYTACMKLNKCIYPDKAETYFQKEENLTQCVNQATTAFLLAQQYASSFAEVTQGTYGENVYQDGDPDNASFDLLLDIQYIGDVLFKGNKEVPESLFFDLPTVQATKRSEENQHEEETADDTSSLTDALTIKQILELLNQKPAGTGDTGETQQGTGNAYIPLPLTIKLSKEELPDPTLFIVTARSLSPSETVTKYSFFVNDAPVASQGNQINSLKITKDTTVRVTVQDSFGQTAEDSIKILYKPQKEEKATQQQNTGGPLTFGNPCIPNATSEEATANPQEILENAYTALEQERFSQTQNLEQPVIRVDAEEGTGNTPTTPTTPGNTNGSNGGSPESTESPTMPAVSPICSETCAAKIDQREQELCAVNCCTQECKSNFQGTDKLICISQCLCGEIKGPKKPEGETSERKPQFEYRVKFCRIPVETFSIVPKSVQSIEEIVDELTIILDKLKESGQLMKHVKTKEMYETSMQSIKFADILAFNFFFKLKPVFSTEIASSLEAKKEDDNKKRERDLRNVQGGLESKEERNKYALIDPPEKYDAKYGVATDYTMYLGNTQDVEEKMAARNTDNSALVEDMTHAEVRALLNDEVVEFINNNTAFWHEVSETFILFNDIADNLKVKVEAAPN